MLALQIIGTLFATLVGVFIAFYLERSSQEKKKKQDVLENLKAIKRELGMNKSKTWEVHDVVKHFQESKNKTLYYNLDLYSTDAWDSSLEQTIIETIGSDLFEDLLETYIETKNINKLIERTQTEWLHPEIGEEADWGGEKWTVGISYYDSEKEEVDYKSVAPRINERSSDLRSKISGIEEELEEEIDRLEKEV